MASETVKAVLLAESHSDERISDARKQADEIIAAAEKSADEELQRQLAVAKSAAEKLILENQRHIEDFRRSTAEKCELQKSQIQQRADNKMSDAADVIIDHLFCQ